jgi:Tfp pilus assembly protein PilZ
MYRKQERITFLTEIVLTFLSGRRQARISDLSVGGCFVDSIVDVREGEEVEVELKLPSGEKLPLLGRVAYVLPGNGFGVAFVNVPEERQKILDDLVGQTVS